MQLAHPPDPSLHQIASPLRGGRALSRPPLVTRNPRPRHQRRPVSRVPHAEVGFIGRADALWGVWWSSGSPDTARLVPCTAGLVPCTAGLVPCTAGFVPCTVGLVPAADQARRRGTSRAVSPAAPPPSHGGLLPPVPPPPATSGRAQQPAHGEAVFLGAARRCRVICFLALLIHSAFARCRGVGRARTGDTDSDWCTFVVYCV